MSQIISYIFTLFIILSYVPSSNAIKQVKEESVVQPLRENSRSNPSVMNQPVDVFHLVDQSGSIESENYLEYLNFAENLTTRFVSEFGLEDSETTGLRVNLFGFGCKLSSSADQTEIFLSQATEPNLISEKFDLARQDDYHPDFARTCVRHVLHHVQASVAGSFSRAAGERKSIVLLYTDGESGDFDWEEVTLSPVFNSPDDILTFAVGISETERDEISENLIKDPSNVFSEVTQSTLETIAAKATDFLVDPLYVAHHGLYDTLLRSPIPLEREICQGVSTSLVFSFPEQPSNSELPNVLCELNSSAVGFCSRSVSAYKVDQLYFCDIEKDLFDLSATNLSVNVYVTDNENLISTFPVEFSVKSCVEAVTLSQTDNCRSDKVSVKVEGETMERISQMNVDLPEDKSFEAFCRVKSHTEDSLFTDFQLRAFSEGVSEGDFSCTFDFLSLQLGWFLSSTSYQYTPLDIDTLSLEVILRSRETQQESILISTVQKQIPGIKLDSKELQECSGVDYSESYEICPLEKINLGFKIPATDSLFFEMVQNDANEFPNEVHNFYCVVLDQQKVTVEYFLAEHVDFVDANSLEFKCQLPYLAYKQSKSFRLAMSKGDLNSFKEEEVFYLTPEESLLVEIRETENCFSTALYSIEESCETSEVKAASNAKTLVVSGHSVDLVLESFTASEVTCVFKDSTGTQSSYAAASFGLLGDLASNSQINCHFPSKLDFQAASMELSLPESETILGSFSLGSDTLSTCLTHHIYVTASNEESSSEKSICAGEEVEVTFEPLFLDRLFNDTTDHTELLSCIWTYDTGATHVTEIISKDLMYVCQKPAWSIDSRHLISQVSPLALTEGENISDSFEFSFKLPKENLCIEVFEDSMLESFKNNETLNNSQEDSCWPDCCKRPTTEISFQGESLEYLNSTQLGCRYDVLENGMTMSYYESIQTSSEVSELPRVKCIFGEFLTERSGLFHENLRSVSLVDSINGNDLTKYSFSDASQSESCVRLVTASEGCEETSTFTFYDVTVASLLDSTNASGSNSWNVSCTLTLNLNQNQNTTEGDLQADIQPLLIPGVARYYDLGDGKVGSEVICEKNSNEIVTYFMKQNPVSRVAPSSSSILKLSMSKVTSSLASDSRVPILPQVFEEEKTVDLSSILECVEDVDDEFSPPLIVNDNLSTTLFSSGAVFAFGLLFLVRSKYKTLDIYKNQSDSELSESKFGPNFGTEDLLDIIVEKESKALNSSKFDVNDLVQVKLPDVDVDLRNSSPSCKSDHILKYGVVVNKKVEHGRIRYEVKLLQGIEIVVTDLVDEDLEKFNLEVGEKVFVMDELEDSKWNESIVINFHPSKATCDVKQGSTRLNDVPIVCIKKAQNINQHEIIVSVPGESKAIDYNESSLLSQSSSNTAGSRSSSNSGGSSKSKRVKFASDVMIETWRPPPRTKTETSKEGKGLYKRRAASSFKELNGGKYEIKVDLSKGLGICWAFDEVDGCIVVGKFVDINSGDWGGLEASGKVGLKDRLESVNGTSVSNFKSLGKVRELIKRSRKKNKEVVFVFTRGIQSL